MKLAIVVTPNWLPNLLWQAPRRIGKTCLLALGRDSQALNRKKTEIKNLDLANMAEISQVIDFITFRAELPANRQKSATCA
jgi:hypothetical protein